MKATRAAELPRLDEEPAVAERPASAKIAATPISISDLPSLDEEILNTPANAAAPAAASATPAHAAVHQKNPPPKAEGLHPAARPVTPAVHERITILPAPADSDRSEVQDDSAAPVRTSKPGIVPVSGTHPYSRMRLSLDAEEMPGLAPPDADEK